MSEDVSAQVRTGCTIILAAALVATVLNLMVVAQGLVAQGSSSLQSGTEQVMAQQYEVYNQKVKTGTEVKTALTMFQNNDISIAVNTITADSKVFLYGALLDGCTQESPDWGSGTEKVFTLPKTQMTVATGKTYIQKEYKTSTGGIVETSFSTQGLITNGSKEFILDSGRFNSILIKNNSGKTVGIYFEQKR